MHGHDIIVVRFSPGGVEARARLVSALPRDLAAALFVAHQLATAAQR
jgi:chemotaxis response regulator CheB